MNVNTTITEDSLGEDFFLLYKYVSLPNFRAIGTRRRYDLYFPNCKHCTRRVIVMGTYNLRTSSLRSHLVASSVMMSHIFLRTARICDACA